MVSATTLATQGMQLRNFLSTSRLLAIIAKTLGTVGSQNGGDAPSLTREQWNAAISDIEGVAESDLLAFVADQLARIFMQGGQPGLSVAGDVVSLSAANLITIATPNVVGQSGVIGAPLVLETASGECEYSLVSERFQVASSATLTASRNVASADLGLTLVYSGSVNITLTIPTGLVGGLKFRVVQAGSGKVTIAGSGVNVNGKNGHLSTGGQWHVVDVIQTAATQFVVYGDTGA